MKSLSFYLRNTFRTAIQGCLILALCLTVSTAQGKKSQPIKTQHHGVMIELMERVAELAVPKTYKKSSHWGDQKNRFNGLKWRRKGILIQVKRQKKLVNHGNWTRYQVDVDPKQPLKINLQNIHQISENQLSMQIVAEGRIHGFIKYQRWNMGVRLLSVDADCDAKMRIIMDCDVKLMVKSGGILSPEFEIAPTVKKTSIQLVGFHLQRVGKIRGPIAKEIGNSVQGLLKTQIRKREGKINQKINQAIVKEKDKLTFSADKFVTSQWKGFVKKIKATKIPNNILPIKKL